MDTRDSTVFDGPSPWTRLAYASGAVFVVLLIAAAFLFPMAPDAAGASGARYAAWLADHRNAVLSQAYLRGLAAVVALVFIGGLSALLWRRSANPLLPLLLFSAGLMHTVILFVSNGAMASAAIAASNGVDGASLRAIGIFSDSVLTLEAFAEAMMFATAAALLLRTAIVPRWIGWFSIAGVPLAFLDAAGFLGSPLEVVGMIALLYSLVWFLTLSIALVRGPRAKPVVHAARPLPA